MNESDDIRRRLLLAGAGGLAALLDLADVDAQDPAKVMPKSYRVVFENDRVRVLEFSGRPGMGICGEGMHSHPAHLTIAMSAWQARASLPDGSIRDRNRSFGEVFFGEPGKHKVENTGNSISRALIIELKAPATKAA